jgi:hypothetical protein
MPHTCTVLRDRHAHDHFPARELVVLTTGDHVPMDLRVIDGVKLSVDKSLLQREEEQGIPGPGGERQQPDKVGSRHVVIVVLVDLRRQQGKVIE